MIKLRWLSLIAAFIFSTHIYAEPETFIIDNTHTYVLWNLNHLGFSNQSGKFYANGQLTLDKDHPEKSKVDVSININDIVTGLPELDKHLKSKLFFDTERYPKATFVSKTIEVTGKNTGKVTGILTIRGVSKPVILDVVFNKAGINPLHNRMTAGFSATGMIKRSDFGMDAMLPSLGDEVKLTIDVEAYQDKKDNAD